MLWKDSRRNKTDFCSRDKFPNLLTLKLQRQILKHPLWVSNLRGFDITSPSASSLHFVECNIRWSVICCFIDMLSRYEFTQPWVLKGRFSNLWRLRASVSFFCLSPPPPARSFRFCPRLNLARPNAKCLKKAEKFTEVLATQAIGTRELRHMNDCNDLQIACDCHLSLVTCNFLK